jgi:cytochrome c oxidase assembly protein subunit 11
VRVEVETKDNKNRKLLIKLVLLTAFSFGFAFALVPLYDVFCDITGFNGKTGDQVFIDENDQQVVADKERLITVQFLSMNNENSAVNFRPKLFSVKVHPGEMKEIFYLATNLTDREMVTQSVPSVSPLEAAEHIKKIECFCFQNQTLAVGETAEMPLRFYIDKELPAEITKLSLNYTIFDITEPKESEEMPEMDHSAH